MLLFLTLFGLFVSFILFLFNARQYPSSVYLSLFFFLVSLYGFYQYILLYSDSEILITLFLFNLPITASPVYLIGPILFWYIRSVLTDNSKLKRNDLWHFLPAAIFFISALPGVLVPWHEKVETARSVIQDHGFILEYKATLFSRNLSPAVMFLSRPILVLIYTLWSSALLINYLKKNKVSAVFSKQQFMKKWLYLLLGLLLILVVSQIFMVWKSFAMHFSDLFFTLSIVRIISVSGLVGLLISPFFFPSILYGLPRVPRSDDPEKPKTDAAEQASGTTVRAKFNLESNYLQEIDEITHTVMKVQQPYLQPECNLSSFSKLINIPAHHLAYYFREIKKQPFNDFRNEWRINHAKALIEKGKANEITLEAIGLHSGFSSRNAFMTDFKKFEGESPGSYAARYN